MRFSTCAPTAIKYFRLFRDKANFRKYQVVHIFNKTRVNLKFSEKLGFLNIPRIHFLSLERVCLKRYSEIRPHRH